MEGSEGLLFLKKKKQKNFYSLNLAAELYGQRMKFFWFFFPKKEPASFP